MRIKRSHSTQKGKGNITFYHSFRIWKWCLFVFFPWINLSLHPDILESGFYSLLQRNGGAGSRLPSVVTVLFEVQDSGPGKEVHIWSTRALNCSQPADWSSGLALSVWRSVSTNEKRKPSQILGRIALHSRVVRTHQPRVNYSDHENWAISSWECTQTLHRLRSTKLTAAMTAT